MQRLQELSDQLKEKKLALSEAYFVNGPGNLDTSNPIVQKAKEPKIQKVKVQVYLPMEIAMLYNELCAERLAKDGHANKSNVICDAIELLYAHNKKEKS